MSDREVSEKCCKFSCYIKNRRKYSGNCIFNDAGNSTLSYIIGFLIRNLFSIVLNSNKYNIGAILTGCLFLGDSVSWRPQNN